MSLLRRRATGAAAPLVRYAPRVISWCAYCQRYIAERPPLDDYSLTHGLCDDCNARGVLEDAGAPARIAPLKAFYERLSRTAARGNLDEAAALLAQGRGLGLEPLEVLIGLVQPALHSVGALWAAKKITIADEHRFTAFCARVVELVDELTPRAPEAERPALLVACEGNDHWLGLRFVELWLRRHGIPSHVVYPGLPVEEIAALAARLKPRFVGLSVALHTQLDCVRELAKQLDVPIVCGGAAIRLWRPRDVPGVTFVDSVEDLARVLRTPAPPSR